MAEQEYDLISIGAHPDDVEVGTGGVLIDQKARGYRCGIVILTQGEMGTGGTPENARAIRIRLSVRSREADRPVGIPTEDGDALFRFGLGESGGPPFARVRTLQADVALQNQMVN